MKRLCEAGGIEHVLPADLDLPYGQLPIAALVPDRTLFLTRAGWSALGSEPQPLDPVNEADLRRFLGASLQAGDLALAVNRELPVAQVAPLLPILSELGFKEISLVFQDPIPWVPRLVPTDLDLYKVLQMSQGEARELAIKAVFQRNARRCPGLGAVGDLVGASEPVRPCLAAATILQERAGATFCFADWDELLTASQVAFAPFRTYGVVKIPLDRAVSETVPPELPWGELVATLPQESTSAFWIHLRAPQAISGEEVKR